MRFALSAAASMLTVAMLTLTLPGCRTETRPPAQAAGQTNASGERGPVEIVIDAGGVELKRVTVADVVGGTTLESVMRSVPEVSVDLDGSGTTAFVNGIDGIKTNSTEGWTFTVDGEFANQGIGQTQLQPPTTIRWSFGEFEME